MIKKKKIIINISAAIRACGSRPVRRTWPRRARPALGPPGPHAGLRPEEALGLFVRLLWPPSGFPSVPALPPQLLGSTLPATRPGLTERWARAGTRRAAAGPWQGGLQGRPPGAGASSSPRASLPTQTHPLPAHTHTHTHTRSHSLSCCLKQVEDLCNDIMPFNKNFMRCI